MAGVSFTPKAAGKIRETVEAYQRNSVDKDSRRAQGISSDNCGYLVKITGIEIDNGTEQNAPLGGGLYIGRIQTRKTNTNTSGDDLDLATLAQETQRDVLVINPAENSTSGHSIAVDTYVVCVDAPFVIDTYPTLMITGGAGDGLIPVRVTKTGGGAGSKTTQCSFTYSVFDKTNTSTLGTGVAMTGNGQRIVNAQMTAGNYGMAYYDSLGNLKLIWVDEKFDQSNCT